ncbi:protein FAR1-RELATED SEQUENCE 11-like isoform X2 [Benincasa hispida]|uniref:protein FAR1-RELATED SEQUENCE 11-like isoform X2 n=1 Tax=Benincasa hispida TaxID=102211 RepID=UPI001902035B|nr:protein FAR1-RELATED SEQUENCE 11-like isoform X2 [Benincasa hispida]
MCLKDAIAMELSTTKHALCIWMIVAKFPSWCNAILGERYNEWKSGFCRLYNLELIEDFEIGWRDMVNSFGLHTNRHVANLYSLRSLWALPFLRNHFFAGMATIGQSKAINAFIQRFLSAQTRLAQFIEQKTELTYKWSVGLHSHLQLRVNKTEYQIAIFPYDGEG